MSTAAVSLLSPEAYLARERRAEGRSDFHDGRLVALAGASWTHNVIAANVSAAINARLEGKPCRAVTSDQKVWIPRTRRFLYPDIVVVCGEPSFRDDAQDALTNPIAILEILSASTEAYDRGEKFRNYQTIDSLLEYVLVAQDSVRVESYVRQESKFWRYSALTDTSEVLLTSLSIELPTVEIYRGLPLSAP